MPELHLKQPGFTCSDCRPLTKYWEKNLENLIQFIQSIYIEKNLTKLVLLMIQHILIVKI